MEGEQHGILHSVWVRMQKEQPPATGCRMAIAANVQPGNSVSTTISNGEQVQVQLKNGAFAGQQLLFLLPPTASNGCACPLYACPAEWSRDVRA